MWNTLLILYEGNKDFKQSKINTLTEEYELFCMEPNEIVASIHMRFSYIINKIENLGNTTSNQDCANKILKSMCRAW